MWKKCNVLIKIIVIVFALELFVFNFDAFRSYANKGYTPPYELGSGLQLQEDGRYLVTDSGNVSIQIPEIHEKLDYIRLDIRVYDAWGNVQPTTINLYLTDEGHYSYYHQGTVTSYGEVEALTYHRLHPYGEVTGLRVDLSVSNGQYVVFENIELDAKVPLRMRTERMVVLAMIVIFVFALKPDSSLHEWRLNLKDDKQKWIVIAVLTLNIMLVFCLVKTNPAFCDSPRWDHHFQYHRLAESLLQGHTWLDYSDTEGLAGLENPYDFQLRRDMGVSEHWDTAFFEGKYYVYFGIVPVLLFYLPYLVLTGAAFPTWVGIAVSMVGIISGAFYLMYQLLKHWFPDTGLGHYLLFVLFLGNGTGVLTLAMRPDFYTLPIVLALAFSLWGIGLWIKAAIVWEKRASLKYIVSGALCLALTAGCRPQFLMGSFLFFPILGAKFWKKWGKEEWKRFLGIAIPYAIVAVGLMLYNYVRFGSPFDFGANYNITTNDMTHRGFYLGRIGEGMFQYLLQLPAITTNFPFVRETYLTSDYLGQTIRENFFGGLLVSHFVLCANFAYVSAGRRIKNREIKWFWLISVGAAVIILGADTGMAGILVRYMTDFSWLLFLGAFVVLTVFLGEKKNDRIITWFLIAAFLSMSAFDLLIGMQLTEMRTFCPEKYYQIQSFFK